MSGGPQTEAAAENAIRSPGKYSGTHAAASTPAFVEWMMGLPAGWVTDTDIPRSAQLKALGNGIVPAQMALALRLLLADEVTA